MKSTPLSLAPIMVFTALPPPPPMPMTLMRAVIEFRSTSSNIDFPPSIQLRVNNFIYRLKKFAQPIGHAMFNLGKNPVIVHAEISPLLPLHAVEQQADARGVNRAGDDVD